MVVSIGEWEFFPKFTLPESGRLSMAGRDAARAVSFLWQGCGSTESRATVRTSKLSNFGRKSTRRLKTENPRPNLRKQRIMKIATIVLLTACSLVAHAVAAPPRRTVDQIP